MFIYYDISVNMSSKIIVIFCINREYRYKCKSEIRKFFIKNNLKKSLDTMYDKCYYMVVGTNEIYRHICENGVIRYFPL